MEGNIKKYAAELVGTFALVSSVCGAALFSAPSAGLVTVDTQFGNAVATLAAAILVLLSAFFGILISLHHRALERRKFIHIMNCEEYLGLRRRDLIPSYDDDKIGGVKRPQTFSFWAVLNPCQHSTAIFILRMHLAIMLFAIIMLATRLYFAAKGRA